MTDWTTFDLYCKTTPSLHKYIFVYYTHVLNLLWFFSLNKNKTQWQVLFISPASWTQTCCICQHKSVTGDVFSWYFTQINIPAWEIPTTSHLKYSISFPQANRRLKSKTLYYIADFLVSLENHEKSEERCPFCSVWRENQTWNFSSFPIIPWSHSSVLELVHEGTAENRDVLCTLEPPACPWGHLGNGRKLQHCCGSRDENPNDAVGDSTPAHRDCVWGQQCLGCQTSMGL